MTQTSWDARLYNTLEMMADRLTKGLHGYVGDSSFVVTPEEMGYDAAKAEKATEYIQKAINAATDNGGGTVLLSKGDYVSGTIVLAKGVRFMVDEGARLLASTDINDYPPKYAKRLTVMDTHMKQNQSLIYCEFGDNVSICGKGIIDGRGLKSNFPGDETAGATPGRPFLIRIIDCTNVHIKDITLKDPACWTQNYLNCENLLIENINVEAQANYNNDGIDIDSCDNVIVRGCTVSSGDDALCFKGCGMRVTGNILVENCTLLSSCNALKIGTDTQGDFRNIYVRNCLLGGVSEEMRRIKNVCSDSAVSWEGMDGGTVENLYVRDVKIVRAMSPFFMRLADRGRVKPGVPKPGISKIRRVVFENITGEENGSRGSYMMGAPEQSIEDVIFRNVHLTMKPSENVILKQDEIGEMTEVYPDAHMIDEVRGVKADAPAYGLWARHVKGLVLDDYKVTAEGDPREEYIFDDVTYSVV